MRTAPSLLLPLCLLGCMETTSEAPPKPETSSPAGAAGKHRLFALSYPTWFVATEIGGDAVQVVDARPEFDDPEVWRPARELVFTMKEDATVFLVGGTFEPWFRKENVSQFLLYRMTDPLAGALIERAGGGANPFLWLEPESLDLAARGLADHLSRILPSEKAGFRARQAQLSERIAELDRQLRTMKLGPVFGSRDAFAYAARAMGASFEHLALDPNAEPGAEVVDRWKRRTETHPATVILVPTPLEPKAEAALSSVGLAPVVFELMTHRSPVDRAEERDYFAIYARNLERLRAALKGR